MPRIVPAELLTAAVHMDWQQVVMNGGPPCFHLEREGEYVRFCGRAERWEGHRKSQFSDDHEFVSLHDLLIETGEAMRMR
jgi:hypothetical protein